MYVMCKWVSPLKYIGKTLPLYAQTALHANQAITIATKHPVGARFIACFAVALVLRGDALLEMEKVLGIVGCLDLA